jgi:hypothetical protein
MASARQIRHSPHVQGRVSKVALATGFIALFALLIVLFGLTRDATQAAPQVWSQDRPAADPAPAPSAAIAERSMPRTSPIAARERPPAPAAPRGHLALPGKQPELAPAAPSFDRELKRDANGKLVPIMYVPELRELIHVAGAAMNGCIERSGQRPTGKATLNFTVSAKNGKLVIDTTGVQDEETLAGYPALLECMHQTAHLLVLDAYPVPELGTPIYVRRHVRLDHGVLAEDSIFDFSYLH